MNILLYEHAQPLQLAAQEMDRDPSHADECLREGGRVEPGRPCTIHEAPKKDMNEGGASHSPHTHHSHHSTGARKLFKAYLAEGVNHLLTAPTSFRPQAPRSRLSACLPVSHSAILSFCRRESLRRRFLHASSFTAAVLCTRKCE